MAECGQSIQESSTCASVTPSPDSLPLDPRKQPLEGGFEVDFVESPKELQTECPVCLQVLCEPYQATCCGYSFCKSCITRLKNNKQRCPTCNESEYEVFSDKRLQRSLYGFRVRCSHQQDGCKWEGELGDLVRHLNADPTPESRFTGCAFVKVKCTLCGEFFDRRTLEEHETTLCLMRPFKCEYCNAYESTCHDVTVNHWPTCRPAPCPKGCGVYIKKSDIENHLATECSNATINCPFAYTGCNINLPAHEMEAHVRDNFYHHVSSVAAHERQLSNQISNFRVVLEASATKVASLEEDKREMREQINQQSQSIQHLQSELEKCKLRQECDRQSITALQTHSAMAPIIFTLDDFENRLKRKEMGWSPPPFYTHPRGYKLLLCVDIYGNGSGKGTHMSVFLSLLKGEFDDHLKWPFRASVTVRLENQLEDDNHHEEVIKYHDSTPAVTAGRVTDEGRQGRPWGKGKFIAHSELNPKYLKDNCLHIGISSVVLQ